MAASSKKPKQLSSEYHHYYPQLNSFYEAKGSYSFFYTCNTWANNGLKAMGQKAALWTPSDFGIFQHYK